MSSDGCRVAAYSPRMASKSRDKLAISRPAISIQSLPPDKMALSISLICYILSSVTGRAAADVGLRQPLASQLPLQQNLAVEDISICLI